MNGAYVLTPERVPQMAKNSIYTVRVLDQNTLAATVAVSRVDLFAFARDFDRVQRDRSRERDCRNHLRVFIDGVPANDPFDGTIHRSDLPAAGLARVETVPGGGATAWGEAPGGRDPIIYDARNRENCG